MSTLTRLLAVVIVLWVAQNAFGQDVREFENKTIVLSEWQLESTVLQTASGEEISTGHWANSRWYPVHVPTTVLNGLVKNGVYPDPRLDMNNYLIPDLSDSFNAEHNLANYSYLPNHVNPWKDPYGLELSSKYRATTREGTSGSTLME